MGAAAVTSEKIEKDLDRINKEAIDKVNKLLNRKIDFQKIVGDLFKSRDYSYTLEPDGNFKILVAPGFSIVGLWKGLIWKVYLHVDFGDNHVKTYSSYGFNQNENIIEMSPAGFEHYLPVFDYLIAKLQELSDKYNNTTKANKTAQLLSMLVAPLQEELKLTATFEPNKGSGGLLKLSRQLAGNLDLTTTLDFENFEKRCKEMAETEKLIPAIADTNFIKSIFYRSSRWKIPADNLIEIKPSPFLHEDNVKMVYNNADITPHGKLFDHKEEIDYDIDIINYLNAHGFKYFVDSRQNLAVLMNSHFWLVLRKDTLYYVYHYKHTNYVYDDIEYYHNRNSNPPLNITKETFLTLLHYVAAVSMINNDSATAYKSYENSALYWYTKKGAIPLVFHQLIEYCLPGGYFYITDGANGDTRVLLEKDGQEGFQWKNYDPDWIQIFLNVIKDYNQIVALPHQWDNVKLKDIKVTVK